MSVFVSKVKIKENDKFCVFIVGLNHLLKSDEANQCSMIYFNEL